MKHEIKDSCCALCDSATARRKEMPNNPVKQQPAGAEPHCQGSIPGSPCTSGNHKQAVKLHSSLDS